MANYRLSDNDLNLRLIHKIRPHIGILLIICVAIFRFDVGYDYSSYYQIVYPYLDPQIDRFEPFSKLICYIAYWMECPQLIFIIFGLINYVLLFSMFKNCTPNFYLAVLTFLAFFYMRDLSNIRQGTAIAITLYGFKYIYSRSFIKYLIVCIIASLFHGSAFIALSIYFIYNWFNTKILTICICFLFIGFKLIMLWMSQVGLYANYLDRLDEFGGGDLKKYTNIVWFLIILLLDIINRRTRKNKKLYFVVIVGLIFPFLLGGHMGERISRYFLVYLCLLIPQSATFVKAEIRSVIALTLVCYFLVGIYIDANASRSLVPYQTIFKVNKEYIFFK